MAKKAQSIVLLSGGLDSVVALTLTLKHSLVKLALTFNYGQRAAGKEIRAARKICSALRVPHQVVRLPWLKALGGSALTDESRKLPGPSRLTESICRKTAKSVWVPGRNTVFISIALAYAEALKCSRIVAGLNREEGATFPDNSAAYADAMNGALREAASGAITLDCPLIKLNKVQIMKSARRIGAPVKQVWPCYDGGAKLCWRCESCLRFKRALVESGNWQWYTGK